MFSGNNSVNQQKWHLAPQAPEDWQWQFPEIPAILRQLLWLRNIKEQKDVDEFLNPDYGDDLHDPFLFNEMEKAVEKILEMIGQKRNIAVYGDYDADGVTGAIILKTTLEALGAKIIDVYLPHREKEGYGLNNQAIKYLKEKGAELIITCDCGVANIQEVDFGKSLGLDFIITDHHKILNELPQAFAIIHPNLPNSRYPFKHLTGGGVAFKLACALIQKAKEKGIAQIENGFEKWLLDLVAISTIADFGPLIGENRTLVKYGLIVLKKTRRLGLKKIYLKAGINQEKIDTWSIAYQITPRINAAGRMNHASAAYKLLIAENEEEAEKLASELEKTNQTRQQEADRVFLEAKEQIAQQKFKYFLSAFDKNWPAGIIGLVASKLSEEFYRPVIVGTNKENGEVVASLRSPIENFDVMDALKEIKNQNAQIIQKFGGHSRAAGLSLMNFNDWPILANLLENLAEEKLRNFDFQKEISIDTELTLKDINWELWEMIEALEPFGEGNPRPIFLIKNLKVLGIRQVGNEGKHLKLFVGDDENNTKEIIGFCFGNICEHFTLGEVIDVVVEIGVNEWNGNQELQLKLIDARLAQNYNL